MSLFERKDFEAFAADLKGAEIVRQWGDASVGKVGGKIFAILSTEASGSPGLSFKCSDMSFDLLPDLPGVRPAPYLARAKWVRVTPDTSLTMDEIAGYITEAHRLIAARLTKAMRAQLGLGA